MKPGIVQSQVRRNKLLRWFLLLPGILALLVIALFTRLNTTALKDQDFYKISMERIEKLQPASFSEDSLRVGWAKQNIVPESELELVGYNRRERTNEIRDSLYCRSMVFSNGYRRIAIIALDMLFCPRSIAEGIRKHVVDEENLVSEVFISCTHTHNGFGGWSDGIIGELLLGEENEEIIRHIIDQSSEAIRLASEKALPAGLEFAEINCKEMVSHRIWREGGETDPFLRTLRVVNSEGETAFLNSFSAHPTCIDPADICLSADYPGAFNDKLQNSETCDFSMFIAGGMASHKPVVNELSFEEARAYGAALADSVSANQDLFSALTHNSLGTARIQLALPDPQFKVFENIAFRPWVFHILFGKPKPYLDLMQIGNLMLIGTPCDFSGELYQDVKGKLKSDSMELIISSFNGEYTGYVIDDYYYMWDNFEARDMSWFGPNQGAYYVEMISRMINTSEAVHP